MFYCLWNYFHKILIILSIYKCTCILKFLHVLSYWLLQRPKNLQKIRHFDKFLHWYTFEIECTCTKQEWESDDRDWMTYFVKSIYELNFYLKFIKYLWFRHQIVFSLNDVTLWAYTVPAILMIIRFLFR